MAIDIGASNHVAFELNNLFLHQPYEVLDDIIMSNDKGFEKIKVNLNKETTKKGVEGELEF